MSSTKGAKNVKKSSCNTPKQTIGYNIVLVIGIVVLTIGIVIVAMFYGAFTAGSVEWMAIVYGGGIVIATGVIVTIYGLARRFCWF